MNVALQKGEASRLMVVSDPTSEATVAAFCKAFREARLRSGLTQAEVAAICRQNGALKRTSTYISDIENGRRKNLTLKIMTDLAAAVGMTLEVSLKAPPASRKKR